MERIVNRFMLVALCVVSVGLLFVIWEAVRPYNVNEIKSFKVPAVVTRNQNTYYVINKCKKMLVDGEVIVYIEDGNTYRLFSTPAATSIGCDNVIQDFIVPNFLEPGTYRLHWVGIYKPNTFRTVTVEAYSNEFQLK